MNEETIRADFERFMSDDGKFPRAIERCGAGNYILSQSASVWRVWRNAYHQCLQSPEIQALRKDSEIINWYFGDIDKVHWLKEYQQGILEDWNAYQWRASMLAAMEQKK